MIKPAKLAEYIGFTENEVKVLYLKTGQDAQEMEKWYDGYSFLRPPHVYNPNSVIRAFESEEYGSYGTSSESYESLKQYIETNFDGLKDAVIAMLDGERILIDPLEFQNDLVSVNNRDTLLTLLVQLGYLAFDERSSLVYIPKR